MRARLVILVDNLRAIAPHKPEAELLQSIGWVPCKSPKVGRGNIAWRLSGEALASANPPIIMDDETKRALRTLLALGIFATVTAIFPIGGLAPVALFAKAVYGGTYFISF